MHQQQHQHQQQQRYEHQDEQISQQQQSHCHAHSTYAEPVPASATLHRHQQQRKHSHSPHPSRHTSPHSHHSHSLHSSPHQSHHHVHDGISTLSPTHTTAPHPPPRPSTQSSSAHAHHHHNHRRRKRPHNHQHHKNNGGGGGGSGGGSGNSSTHGTHGHSHTSSRQTTNQHGSGCSRRHRSATDVSSTSVNTCHDPTCVDREVQEIFVRKTCCSSSRTELAQYFAEDLYGTSRRPSSCCTSSDYCYQTDSTSLYGSRSTLSRNNSIKSASVAMRKRRLHQRQPSYTSISLRGLNSNQQGSLTSIFDRAKQLGATASDGGGSAKVVVSPSKVTIERQTSKDALSNDLPEYACSPSPIRWSFLADGKSPTEFEGSNEGIEGKDPWAADELAARERAQKYECEHGRHEHNEHHHPPLTGGAAAVQQTQHRTWKSAHDERPSTSAAARKQTRDSPFSCEFEESTTVLFHQEGEAFNNCCSNYIQCNTYLDQDLQITSEDIQQYLSKGNQQAGDILNNSKNYPFQPTNLLEFQYKNNFANNNAPGSSEGGDSVRGAGGFEGRFRSNSSKETNLNQNSGMESSTVGGIGVATASGGAYAAPLCSSTPLSPTNINLSSSTNNINIVFNSCMERNANEVKFINTAARENIVSAEAHHSGYLPYTYPTYDYTNMSANSLFDKPLGIDELPKDFAAAITPIDGEVIGAGSCSATASDGQHSSSLHSPVRAGCSFESFDAASEHNLLSRRGSYQFSPITPRSPLSPASPATSSLSASINPAAASYMHNHHLHYGSNGGGGGAGSYQRHRQSSSPTASLKHYHHHHNQYHHHHFTESFKFSNAFKRVRKRARKYTDFLRNKK